MNKVQRSALVMYSDQAMFDLVNDVANYPAFMDGCQSAEVFEHSDKAMVARLDFANGSPQKRGWERQDYRIIHPSH